MSTVVYSTTIVPDKKLVKEHIYKYHPDAAMRQKIEEDIKKHSNEVMENFVVEINVEVRLKQYDPSHKVEGYWYNYPYPLTIKDDPKNT